MGLKLNVLGSPFDVDNKLSLSTLDSRYLKLEGSNANTTIDIQGEDLVNVGNLGLGTDSPSKALHISKDAPGSPVTVLVENNATSSIFNRMGFEFRSRTSSTALRRTGILESQWIDNNNATRTSQFKFSIQISGSEAEALNLKGTEAVFNDDANNIDFRVEGTSDSFLLFGNAGTNRVGMGTSTPSSRFHITGQADETQLIVQANDTQTTSLAEWQDRFGTVLVQISNSGTLETNKDRVKSLETSTTTATMSDGIEVHICNGTSDYTLTLPEHVSGKEIIITNSNTGVVTLSPTSGRIKGSITKTLNQWESLILISDGSDWL